VGNLQGVNSVQLVVEVTGQSFEEISSVSPLKAGIRVNEVLTWVWVTFAAGGFIGVLSEVQQVGQG
jgi:hypothetical protein